MEQDSIEEETATILNVYEDNFIEEIKKIGTFVEEYSYIGMDTEFPGIVYNSSHYTNDFYYDSMKLNVDSLHLIQLGITLTNKKGERPKGTSTWQFNLCFNDDIDKYNSNSYGILCSAGIDFNIMKSRGIQYDTFAEYLTTSGLVLNPNVYWVSYHGCYDFAYLLRMLLNIPLPSTESEFTDQLQTYFPHHYDLKVLLQDNDKLNKGGLNRLAYQLNINRIGQTHQAGSDSYVTIEAFHRCCDNMMINEDNLEYDKNILFGLGKGSDNGETIYYTQFSNMMMNNDFSHQSTPFNSNQNFNYNNKHRNQMSFQSIQSLPNRNVICNSN